MYPTKEQLEDLLLASEFDRILDDFLFRGLPFSFSEQPTIHRAMVRDLSRGLKVPEQDICVVGSARIGFSLSPFKFGVPFNQSSDLDIVVVSSSLFDPSWTDILTNRHVPWSSLRKTTRNRLNEHRENHYIYNGWITPHFVAEALGIGAQWLDTFNGLSRIPVLSTRPVSGRLYRTWDHARFYHHWSLRRVREKLVNRS